MIDRDDSNLRTGVRVRSRTAPGKAAVIDCKLRGVA